MNSLTTNVVALLAGFLLAAGTAYGVVASQQSSGTEAASTPVSYGNN